MYFSIKLYPIARLAADCNRSESQLLLNTSTLSNTSSKSTLRSDTGDSIQTTKINPPTPTSTMIQLLFPIVLSEMTLILLLLFKTPMRRAVILALDRTKRSHGPIVVKTVAGTVMVVMISSFYGLRRVYKKKGLDGGGDGNLTDQVLMSTHLLEATFMGAILSLGLIIDRLHHYIRELRLRRRNMDDITKQNRTLQDEKEKLIKSMENELSSLQTKLKHLESELSVKTERASVAEASVVALSKQSEGLLLEYDRLLEENQKFQKQLRLLDQRFSRSSSKKSM